MSVPAFLTRRRFYVPAITGLALLSGMGIAWALDGNPDLKESNTTPSPGTSEATPPPLPIPSAINQTLGDLVVTTAVDTLLVYDTPEGTTPSHSLGRWSLYGQPLTLLGLDTEVIDGETWIQALLPIQPNGTTGWVRGTDVTITSTTQVIHVYLDERKLEFSDNGVLVASSTAVVGASDTPTPVGTFYVTDPLDLSANPTGIYGTYALGLSGFSEVLPSFDGGPPQLAIHGTNEPWLLGEAISNGCIRVSNEAILDIAATVTLGTPVIIEATRPPADTTHTT